ncbi:MAG: O-antigen ligase family protein [Undibacterium sp.]
MEQASVSPLMHDLKKRPIWADPRAYIVSGAIFLLFLLAAKLFGVSLLLPVALIAGVAGIVALYRSPLVLLATLIVIRMSLDYSSQYVTLTLFERTFSLSQLLGIGIAGLGILFILLNIRTLGRYTMIAPYGLIILWGLGTLLYSIAPSTSAQEALRIFDLFVVGFMAYASVERYRDFRILLMAIFVSSLLPILFGLYQFAFGIGLTDENVSVLRIFGTFSHPNVFSLYLFTVAAVATIYLIVYARKDGARLLTLLYIGLVLFTLFLTFARIAWISLFVFLFFLAWWRFRFLILPLILLPIVLTVFVPAINQRVTEALNPTPDSSITWRQNLWHDMILKTRLEERIRFGSGLDTFRISSEQLRGDRFGSNEPHNDFVKFYVEGGLVGLGVFILYLIAFAFPALQVKRLSPSHSLKNMAILLLLLIATLVIASLSDNVFKNTPVQWILSIVMGGFLSLFHYSLPRELQNTY